MSYSKSIDWFNFLANPSIPEQAFYRINVCDNVTSDAELELEC